MTASSARPRALVRVGLVLAAALAVSGVAAVVPAAAHAGGITVQSVVTADSGGIDVHLQDSTALSVAVDVLSADSSTVLYSTDDLTYSYDRGWYTDTPVRLPAGDGYGDYPVSVDFRLQTGTVQHWTGGRFGYRKHVHVTSAAFDRDLTDYDHRSVVLSGTAETYDPVTGTSGPTAAGTPLRASWQTLSDGVEHSQGLQVGDAGTFSGTVTPGGILQYGQLVAAPTAADTAPPTDTVALPDLRVVPSHVRVAATPTRVRVHSGTVVTVSGIAQRLTSTGWQPLAAAPVETGHDPAYAGYPIVLVGHATADAAGRFGYGIRATSTTTWTTRVHPSDYVVDDADGTSDIVVPGPGAFGKVAITLDQFGLVTAKTSLHGAACYQETVILQHSPNGHTGWASLARAQGGYSGSSCAITVSAYGYVDGFYRLAHAEDDAMVAITSPTVHLYRTDTRITGFSLTPTSVRRGATITGRGQLTQYVARAWRPLAKVRVQLLFVSSYDGELYYGGQATTDSSGRFTIRSVTLKYTSFSGKWAAVYYADAKHFLSATKQVAVHVR